MTTEWVERYARRTERMRSSAIRELLKLTGEPDIISFAGGLPAPEPFPKEEVLEATRHVLEEQPCLALQYKVAFVPGSPFYPHGGGENTLRINFSNASPAQIEEGIKRLATVIRAEMAMQAIG